MSIEFSALSYINPETNRYRYKLDGIDKDWREVGCDERLASYTTLPAGDHTFRLEAATSRGPWSADVVLELRILPPFWQTYWFFACSVAALCLTLGLLYRLRLNHLSSQFNIRTEERVSERTRIARELHDTLLQNFNGLLLRFQGAYNHLPSRPEEARKALGVALERGSQAITAARDAVQELRSSASGADDLPAAIAALSEELRTSQLGSPSPAVEVEVGGKRNLHPIVRDDIYRIIAEAIRNACRHAEAAQIHVAIQYGDREFQITVRDDGKGIDPEVLRQGNRRGHWGLPGMQERAEAIGAALDVWSCNGAGTKVTLRVPATIAYANSAVRRFQWFNGKQEGNPNERDSNSRS